MREQSFGCAFLNGGNVELDVQHGSLCESDASEKVSETGDGTLRVRTEGEIRSKWEV